MNAALSTQLGTVHPYREIYERFAVDAAFLWLLRSVAVAQPNYTAEDLAELEQRIDAQLDGLMTAPEEGWEICAEAMELHEPGEVFAASVLAFRSLDVAKIQHAVTAGLATDAGCKGLISALGWLPGRLCHSWIKRFLTSKDFDHKYLAIAACSVRREDPREYLTAIFQRSECLAHKKLYARSLRLVGELKRRDLMPALRIAMRADDPNISFWANWSAVLLGDKTAVANLRTFVLEENPHQAAAINLVFRALPMPEARSWISELAEKSGDLRAVIKATATLGDPHAVNWLIAQMQNPVVSRLAGEAFTTITGIDLEEQRLALENLPDLEAEFPNDDPEDANVELDEDENLPFPDAAKVAAVWQRYQHRFTAGRRYFLGRSADAAHISKAMETASQRHRTAAATELALIDPSAFLLNSAAKSHIEE